MSFQWNHSGPSRQGGNQTQPMSQWSNQDQYNPGHQYNMQENRSASNDWSNRVPYHQWCPPTSQEQMNWACTQYSSSHYPQQTSNNFNSNVYPRYSHSKSNFGDNFTGLYDEAERNNVFDYPKTNSFMSGQGNNSYRVSQNSFSDSNSSHEPTKLARNHNGNDNFLYWNERSESENMNYMPHPLYSPHATDNILSSSRVQIKADTDSNRIQQDLMQSYDVKRAGTQYGHISKPDVTSSRFSNSQPSDYFMGAMSHDSLPSNMSPIPGDGNTKKFFSSLCHISSLNDTNSSLATSRCSQTITKEGFRFHSNLQDKLELTNFLKKEVPTPIRENFLQEETFDLEERTPHKSVHFKEMDQVIDQSDFGNTFIEEYQLHERHTGMKVPQLKANECFEGDMKWENMGHNVPSYIDFKRHEDEYGPRRKDKYVPPSWKDQCEPSVKSQYIKPSQQNLRKLKAQTSQNFSNYVKSENISHKAKKAEEQMDSNSPSKNSPAKKVRRAVLKYLLKQSSHIEKCFSELRQVKKMLKDNPADKEVNIILKRVEMQINQSRLSLKEKKKVCAKSNIRLRSLTIKSTGTNILQTLESDMYHLRRFYSALSHIARHLGTIEKPSLEPQNPSATSTEEFSHNPSQSHFLDELCNSDREVMSPKNTHHENAKNVRERCLNGPPQKSARFMYLERRYWDRLMEMSYLIRSQILALRQAERSYKNGKMDSLAELKTIIETPHGRFKKDYKLLIHWKKRYNFSRHIPSYILERYPEQERRSRDKITMKSVRKNLATFMSLCYSTNVLIRSSKVSSSNQNANVMEEEAKFWKRLVIINQKIQTCQSELSKLQLTLTVNCQDKKSLDTLIRIEARVKEIDSETQKEEAVKQKNGFCDVMPNNAETEKLKLNCAECKNFLVLKESLQNMKTTLSEVKSFQTVFSSPNQELPVRHPSCLNSNTPNPRQRGTPVQALSEELPSDLALFFGDGPSGWI